MKGFDIMSSIWKTDKIPDNNTLEKEVDRLKRIIVALSLAIMEKRYKHVHRDIDELFRCHEELERLIQGDDDENSKY